MLRMIAIPAIVLIVGALSYFLGGGFGVRGASIVPTGALVTGETSLHMGGNVHVESDGSWYERIITSVHEDGRVGVHYDGWESRYDEDVPRSRLRLIPVVANDAGL